MFSTFKLIMAKGKSKTKVFIFTIIAIIFACILGYLNGYLNSTLFNSFYNYCDSVLQSINLRSATYLYGSYALLLIEIAVFILIALLLSIKSPEAYFSFVIVLVIISSLMNGIGGYSVALGTNCLAQAGYVCGYIPFVSASTGKIGTTIGQAQGTNLFNVSIVFLPAGTLTTNISQYFPSNSYQISGELMSR
jgi:hypothetical protein